MAVIPYCCSHSTTPILWCSSGELNLRPIIWYHVRFFATPNHANVDEPLKPNTRPYHLYKNNANLYTILYNKKHISRLVNDDLYISTNHNRRYITVNMPSIYYHCKHKRPPMTLSIFFRFSFFHSLGNWGLQSIYYHFFLFL